MRTKLSWLSVVLLLLAAVVTAMLAFPEVAAAQAGWVWQNPLPQGNSLTGIWGLDANNVWAVGTKGTIVNWNGSTWSMPSSGTTEMLLGVWGSDANNVWAVGGGGTILKWDGSAWNPQNSSTTADLTGVWGVDSDNVWAVGRGSRS